MKEEKMEKGHSRRCDYSQTPVPPYPECYCPTPAEESSRLPCGHMPEVGCWCAEIDGEG